jgi:hypothetical protein
MTRWTVLKQGAFVLVLGVACAHLPALPTGTEPPVLLFETPRYDGHGVSGRVLVGARGPMVVDRRLIEGVSVAVDRVTDCAMGTVFPTLVADVLPEPATRDDLLVLNDGEWFGREVSFPVFMEPFSPPEGPACIEFTLSFHPPVLEGSAPPPPVTLQVKVERDMGSDAGPSVDAGG